MALKQQGAPIKIVYLGHRDGTAMMVHKDSSIRNISDLRGKTIAIPNRYSNQYLVCYKALRDAGLSIKDLKILEMPPPDMPTALSGGAVDAITAGEPWMAKAEVDGYGRVLYQAKDIWPHFISCVLVVHERVIAENPEWVLKLVEGIARSGLWMEEGESHRVNAAEGIAKPYFNQEPALLRYVLTTPLDRVTYANLGLARKDFEQIEKLAIEAGILNGSVSFDQYADASFSEKVDKLLQQEKGILR
jgi:NitT/TauT family transport system substrate-binding protein